MSAQPSPAPASDPATAAGRTGCRFCSEPHPTHDCPEATGAVDGLILPSVVSAAIEEFPVAVLTDPDSGPGSDAAALRAALYLALASFEGREDPTEATVIARILGWCEVPDRAEVVLTVLLALLTVAVAERNHLDVDDALFVEEALELGYWSLRDQPLPSPLELRGLLGYAWYPGPTGRDHIEARPELVLGAALLLELHTVPDPAEPGAKDREIATLLRGADPQAHRPSYWPPLAAADEAAPTPADRQRGLPATPTAAPTPSSAADLFGWPPRPSMEPFAREEATEPACPDLVRGSGCVSLTPAAPRLATIRRRYPSGEQIDQAVPLYLAMPDGHAILSALLVLTSMDWTLPAGRNWWHVGLELAEAFPALGHRMLAQLLAMMELIWHDEDPWLLREEEALSWTALVDPDETFDWTQAEPLLDYLEHPDADRLAKLHQEHPRWIPTAAKLIHARALGKLTSAEATGMPTVPAEDVITVLACNAFDEHERHLPDPLAGEVGALNA